MPIARQGTPERRQEVHALIEQDFTYHSPTGDQPQRYVDLRNTAMGLAMLIENVCPDSYHREQAFLRLNETVMWANKAIACNE